MRRVGPDIPLLSELTKLKQDEILSLLSRIKGLSFTPIPANRFMKLKFSSRIYTRKSVKTDLSFLFDKEGVEVVRFENFSGIPETYDYDTDTWNYDGSIKATPLVHDFQYEGEVEPIDFSTLRSPKSMTDVLREANSKGLIQCYVVDYGSREFLLDVITLNPEVKEAFQYFPFIRFVAHLRGDEATFLSHRAVHAGGPLERSGGGPRGSQGSSEDIVRSKILQVCQESLIIRRPRI
jgi:hypothetical protein